MKNIIIGTAGHIDHGKTTLIKNLTGKDTDTLPEEKKRGITIDIGFSYLEISENKKIGIIDVPGHEKFIKNMIAGISGINYIILTVACDDGVMPQTEEHFNIAELLGIKYGVIVLTKCDLVNEEQKSLVKKEIKNLVKNSFLENAEILETSAKDKNSYEKLKNFLIKDIEKCEKEDKKSEEKDFRMYVDRAFSVKGFGTVITGTVLQGEISVGNSLYTYPLNSKVRIKSIENHGIRLEKIEEGNRCALNISDIEKENVKRGSIVSSAPDFKSSDIIDVMFEPLSNVSVKNNQKIKVYFGTREILGKIKIFTENSQFIKINDKKIKHPAQIYLEEKAALIYKEKGIIRDSVSGKILGGVKVLNLSSEKIKQSNILYAEKLINIYKEDETFENKKDSAYLKNILENFHKFSHLERGILRAELKNKYFKDFSHKDFKKFIDENIIKNEIKSEKIYEREYLSLKDYKIKLTKDEKELKEKIFKIYKESRFIPKKQSIIEGDFLNAENFRNIHNYLYEEGMIIFLENDFYILKGFLKEAEKLIKEYLKEHEKITLSETRTLLNIDRLSAVMILEKLDKLKITERNKDYRILYKGEKHD
ncbi:selenocysteine-specific translation elongation factor [Fusobacterium perfoetens]|uniref:selenocysteine-specific translation elongation factor n=1 Tax=Fusobacterium perfoetens TaxID=852 RepID=UPI001F17DA06|nr:selenocysteine-specific translation elongation factor [Fusobacterium perfoetens]MCF2625088.1 selenocysteine-specific translation elongation factor [Fusobacterium perfoetens]